MKKRVNRRDFFRLSATAGASAFLIPGASARIKEATIATQEIKYLSAPWDVPVYKYPF